MDTKELLDTLVRLIRLEIDLSHCYAEAVGNSGLSAEREMLESFLIDHDSHIGALAGRIESLGEAAPAAAEGGFFTSGMRAVSRTAAAEEALEDLLANETLMLMAYRQEQLPSWQAADEERIDRNASDEDTHMRLLAGLLRSRARAAGRGG